MCNCSLLGCHWQESQLPWQWSGVYSIIIWWLSVSEGTVHMYGLLWILWSLLVCMYAVDYHTHACTHKHTLTLCNHMITWSLIHLQLSTEPTDASGSFVQLLDTYTGLGPILDMVAVDLTRQGYDQVVCLSVFYMLVCLSTCVFSLHQLINKVTI